MTGEVQQAIDAVLNGKKSYCKFLAANDTKSTTSHQSGIYIALSSSSILFDKPGEKGENLKKNVKIKWHDYLETDSCFTYYGCGSRNEYRITRFGRNFEFIQPKYTGALFVLVQDSFDYYQAFVLNTDDEITQFLDFFSISPTATNSLIQTEHIQSDQYEQSEFDKFIRSLEVDFPSSEVMAARAREIQDKVYDHADYVRTKPDQKLIDWTNMEFKLFRAIESARYGDIISKGFSSITDFIETANAVLNRRKSRAGKSLEHHLTAIFNKNNLLFETQAVTEGNKKPDFIFPSQKAYHDLSYPTDKLITLAAKTTCKDRWRQVINEADRLRDRTKFLCTLQQGISSAQMDEMQAEKITLVVPASYIDTYPSKKRDRIWPLDKFINYVREIER